MAGMPRSVVARAEDILAQMEKSNRKEYPVKPVGDLAQNREGYQLSIFQLDDPVLKQIRDEIKNLDINRMSPLEALNKLNEIKKITGM
jgi:DNA mismatch repair protein MutS